MFFVFVFFERKKELCLFFVLVLQIHSLGPANFTWAPRLEPGLWVSPGICQGREEVLALEIPGYDAV